MEVYNSYRSENQSHNLGMDSNFGSYLEPYSSSMTCKNAFQPGTFTEQQLNAANMFAPPQLNQVDFLPQQEQNRRVSSNWREEPEVFVLRAFIRNKILEILQRLPSASRRNHKKRDTVVNYLEELHFREAPSKEEYLNEETMKHFISITAKSKLLKRSQKLSSSNPNKATPNHQGEVARSSGQVIHENPKPFQSFTAHSSTVGFVKYQREELNKQDQKYPSQGVLSYSHRNDQFVASHPRSEWVSQEEADQQILQHQTQTTLPHFCSNGDLEAQWDSSGYIYEETIAHGLNCQQQHISQQIEYCNGTGNHKVQKDFAQEEADQQILQHQTQTTLPYLCSNELETQWNNTGYIYEGTIADGLNCQPQDVYQQTEHYNGTGNQEVQKDFTQEAYCFNSMRPRCNPTDYNSYFNEGTGKHKRSSYQSRYDGDDGTCGGDILDDVELPRKRCKIDHQSSPLSSLFSLSSQGPPQMHQQNIPVDKRETLNQWQIYDSLTPLSEYENVPGLSPVDATHSPQRSQLQHQRSYLPLFDQSNVLKAELELSESCIEDCANSVKTKNEYLECSLELKHDAHPIIPKKPTDITYQEQIMEETLCSIQDCSNSIKMEKECQEDPFDMNLDWNLSISKESIPEGVREDTISVPIAEVEQNITLPAVDQVEGSKSNNSDTQIWHHVPFASENIQETPTNPIQDHLNSGECKVDDSESSPQVKPQSDLVISEELITSCSQEHTPIQTPIGHAKHETEDEVVVAESDNSKIEGASLTECFTPEQMEEHLQSLKMWFGESNLKAEKKRAMSLEENSNACPMCAVEKLHFAAPCCSLCSVHFKHNSLYFTSVEGDAKYFFCCTCYRKTEGETIMVGGHHISKGMLEKTKCYADNEEQWVYCDKCGSCQHQICALFNDKKNMRGEAAYICPKCYVEEIATGKRMPLPESAILGAKDLPRTKLSDFIEERLSARLKQERQKRAKAMGKKFDEVPGAEGLVLRVVSSVDKTLQVKQNFLDAFQGNYPKKFPYRSKVIFLFQKIEGVEVCLFGMCVQEFGSECTYPNRNSVYISYLDSVKYFRPVIETASGEALRTFVYREIMVGYLDYCRKRGFKRCYIWSCPPTKSDNFIFYCHPEIQKTPKAEILREWYQTMLKRAASEKIVSSVTNMYNRFFAPDNGFKVTATRLPYFDGDYWPRAAEDVLKDLRVEDRTKPGGKPNNRKQRSVKASACTEGSKTSVTDNLLMKELGKSIFNNKEDFIVVNLKSQQMALDKEDKDEIIDSKILDSREAFLHFCESNHYQFNTLRQAKHSTMMLLYHLHNPSA